MAEIIIPGGGGGGVTSDDVTAARDAVVKGFRTITSDSNDEIVEGALLDKDTETRALLIQSKDSYNVFAEIPKGAYRRGPSGGNPLVYYPLTEYGNAPVGDVLSGSTFTSRAGLKKTGTMPNRGAPGHVLTSQGQVVSLPYGYYNSVYVKAEFANLSASNIRKGVSIGGVVGTLEDLTLSQSVFNDASSFYPYGLMRDGALSRISFQDLSLNADNSGAHLTPEGTLFVNHDFRMRMAIRSNQQLSNELGFISKRSIPMHPFNTVRVVINANGEENGFSRIQHMSVQLRFISPGSRREVASASKNVTVLQGWNAYYVDIDVSNIDVNACLAVRIMAVAKSWGPCAVDAQIYRVELNN